MDLVGVFIGEEEGGGVRSGPGEARNILLLHIISDRASQQPLVRVQGGAQGRVQGSGTCLGHVCVKPASQDSNQVVKSSLRGSMDMEGGGGFLVFSFFSVVCVFEF